MKKLTIVIVSLQYLFTSILFSQNTVGLISLNNDESIGGYNLIYPERQSNVFLINECGEIVHTWEDSPENRPGKTAYLLENGNLLRSTLDLEKITEPSFGAGGSGGVVEILNWENESLWCYVLADSLNRQHHDVHYMENGNVLLIAWENIGFEEMLENGFDSAANNQVAYWPDYIRELNPVTSDTVWEWHAWDHLVQDLDSTKANYGMVADHPDLIDINYNEYSGGRADWMHSNAIDYDPVKDQVLLSVRNFNEIWIIDHSTTTAEAIGHTGGNSGKGGDLLYRWGNPKAYNKGETEDRRLFFQHDAQWIDDFVDPGYEHFGKIVLYNNFIDNSFSLGQIIEPVWNENTAAYLSDDGVYLPGDFTENISHPDLSKNFSGTGSSIQIIGDGHIVMCAAQQGFMFELTPEGEVAWQYITPLKNGFPVPQGFELEVSDNFTFQCERYPEYFSGFTGKDLSPIGFIELEPNTSACMVTNEEEIVEISELNIFPNPVVEYIHLEMAGRGAIDLEVFNNYGKMIFKNHYIGSKTILDVSSWPSGIYFFKENISGEIQKIIISR